ncbi:MAG: 50S ribosomal protein L11 methyltransferase [Burkholderiales bacterium]
MAFVAIVVELESDEGDRLSNALIDAGALSVSCEDAASGTSSETPVFDEPGEIASWPQQKLTALCRTHDDPEQLLDRACALAGIITPAFELRAVADEDWVRRSREQFAPIQVSGRLWVVPSWHTPPRPDALNLVLDPGLAFGTGGHPTTHLCLAWLESRVGGGETVLDYGCGSGILTIAALKLGARRAIGVDIDPDAVVTARANAERNCVTAEFSDTGTSLTLIADIVVANILANPLKVLAPLLASHCAKGAQIALSGILAPQAKDVEAHYAPWFKFEPAGEMEGWVCLSGTRI